MRHPLGAVLSFDVPLAPNRGGKHPHKRAAPFDRTRSALRRYWWLPLALGMSACASTAADGGKSSLATDPLERVQPDELYQQGERLALQGDPIRAEQYLSTAIQRGYPAGRALPLLLRVCLVSSRLGAALQYAAPYLRLHPDDYHLRYLVAAVQLGLDRPNVARSELERVLLQAPDYAEAHYLLAIVLRDHLNDTAGAAAEFAQHQRLSPGSLHGAEVSAWLREHDKQSAANQAASGEPTPPAVLAAPQAPAPVSAEGAAPKPAAPVRVP
jgi:tetratricopeptide (TPR) repeat protein